MPNAVAIAGENGSIPPLTLLRCGIMDYGKGNEERNPLPRIYFVILIVKFYGWLVRKDYDMRGVCVCIIVLRQLV